MFGLIPKKKGNGALAWREPGELSLTDFHREFNDLWERFLSEWREPWSPLAEEFGMGLPGELTLEDRPTEFVLRAELPGFEPEEIEVTLRGDALWVRAEKKEEKKEAGREARRYGVFEEYRTLPHGVAGEQIEARYHSGVLEVVLPKTEESRGKRIAVKPS